MCFSLPNVIEKNNNLQCTNLVKLFLYVCESSECEIHTTAALVVALLVLFICFVLDSLSNLELLAWSFMFLHWSRLPLIAWFLSLPMPLPLNDSCWILLGGTMLNQCVDCIGVVFSMHELQAWTQILQKRNSSPQIRWIHSMINDFHHLRVAWKNIWQCCMQIERIDNAWTWIPWEWWHYQTACWNCNNGELPKLGN